jgi:RimJ/RimL family protein N-acetyltransferase
LSFTWYIKVLIWFGKNADSILRPRRDGGSQPMLGAEIPTKSLRLVLQTREETLAAIDAMSPADRAEVSPDWLARVRASTGPDPWALGFAVVHRASATVIGKCGYKGPPDPDGTVEIAYGIDPDHREKGFATEAAEALVRYAFGDARVRVVRAHTIEQANASARVLTKCGFDSVGEVIDPEDGLVWRWQKLRGEASEPSGSPDTARRVL